ncbi:MAG: FAD/NAD(P)-binding protein [Candidatus Micrarchaeota archaeon]|nr:FAD/NAD(P)-binding protein [Candidatus Micrarchaeota archaeon]
MAEKTVLGDGNWYLPKTAVVKKTVDEAPGVKTLSLAFQDPRQQAFSFEPGQFVEVSVFGVGEAAISISSPPDQRETFDISVKKAGAVSKAVHELKKGGFVGVRGPFGTGYPVKEWSGKNIVLVAGGIGIAPMRSLLKQLLDERHKYGRIQLFYGARSPDDFVFKKELAAWEKKCEVLKTIDKTCTGWKGCVGVVTQYIDEKRVSAENAVAAMCGPPAMMHYAAEQLEKTGFSEGNIFVSVERMMHCGKGKCGHCMVNHKYVCRNGSVMADFEAVKLKD